MQHPSLIHLLSFRREISIKKKKNPTLAKMTQEYKWVNFKNSHQAISLRKNEYPCETQMTKKNLKAFTVCVLKNIQKQFSWLEEKITSEHHSMNKIYPPDRDVRRLYDNLWFLLSVWPLLTNTIAYASPADTWCSSKRARLTLPVYCWRTCRRITPLCIMGLYI